MTPKLQRDKKMRSMPSNPFQAIQARWLLIGVLATGVLASAVVGSLAFGSESGAKAPRSVAASSAPPRCAPNAPFTPEQCAAAVARMEQEAKTLWPANGSAIAESEAIQRARGTSSAPAYGLLTTYGNANTLLHGEANNPNISAATPVWVVTVHAAPRPNSGIDGANVPSPNVYTVVLDAVNGELIDTWAGGDVVSAAGIVNG